MLASEIILEYFGNVEEGLKEDASNKKQKIPVSSFRSEADSSGGQFYAADYMKYLVYGRPSGKQPPPDKMLQWVKDNPQIFASAKASFKYITEKGLAYIVGRKIAKDGTDIWEGKKEGIDLLGVMEKNLPKLLSDLGKNEVQNIMTSLKNAI